MHAQLAEFLLGKGDGPVRDDGWSLGDGVHHLLCSNQPALLLQTLMRPALCEARVSSGNGQQLLADVEDGIARLQEAGRAADASKLQEHFEFLALHYARLRSGAPWSALVAVSTSAVPPATLRGIVAADAALPSRTVRIFTSSTFDDLKVCAANAVLGLVLGHMCV